MTIRRIFGRRAAGLAAVLSAGALALSACAGGGAGSTTDAAASGAAGSAEGIKVGIAMPTQTSERWIADGNAVKEGLEKAGYLVDLQYANDDIPTQTQQIDQMITNGAKILVIASIDGTALSSQLDAAGAANIPVVSYDRLIRDNENVDFYVSFDNYKVGVAQAKALLFGLGLTDKDGNKAADAPKGPLNIELFAGSPDDNNAGFFFNGAMDTLKPFIEDGTLVVKSGQTAFDQAATLRWSQEAAQKRMEDILTSTYGGGSEPLAGVLSPFDGISRGIITALQGAGYGPTIADGLPVVTGQDAEIASIKLINDGVQQSTIFKDTRLLAEQAVKTVKAIGSGSEPEANDTETYDNGMKVVPAFLLEVQTILKDNIESDIIGSGYYTADEVAAGVSK
ncbi:multiple monosaccharide ABC transporter substrate-binding protein [Schaalia hyovaginalis]|uniref:Multiple sugar transport system substrate-binding protein n=1 Tax=Schaalia hyovaginalis TaxID=29316 RepID=A0A923E5U7_9ACTO|nr:multiple monosaccharide ABC transporter substrate-binding protein [Schaalia hyovaginalis]MBB6335175.1 putative multiple sugar transport system substrate-binding protein [Schaalia hyovaginalis]MDY2668547.1 multiple monosaccharide ABC transporter substrate-binding protein [Schaalia hyovaginalis]